MKRRPVPPKSKPKAGEAEQGPLSGHEPSLTAYDIARKNGLIGVVRNAPRDLSTGKAHLDGFGLNPAR
jgi:hypothetical protein